MLIYLTSELSHHLLNVHIFVFCVQRLWVDRGQWHLAKQDSGLCMVDRGLWESGASSVWRETPHILTAVGQGMTKCGITAIWNHFWKHCLLWNIFQCHPSIPRCFLPEMHWLTCALHACIFSEGMHTKTQPGVSAILYFWGKCGFN